ncbi:MAG: hypothetical protein RLY16_1011 [Bacteroidota bacterium]|jgi:hypothetical protein
MKKIFLIIGMSLCFGTMTFAQDDLLGDLEKEDAAKVKENIATASFKSTRIINMNSTEMTGVGNLQFMIIHHFGPVWIKDKGVDNFSRLFGLNAGFANTYMSFDYSVKRYLNLGIAFTGNQSLEGTLKLKLMRQQTGLRNFPVSVAWLSTAHVNASKDNPAPNGLGWNKFVYLHQLLVSRKFNENFSLQIMPSAVHYNIVGYGYSNNNTVYSLGIGGRYKLSAKKAITFEYSRQLNMYKGVIDKAGAVVNYVPDLLSLGYDWDTGGHIFQFFVSSSSQASNIPQLSVNTNKITPGNFSIGFNLNRSYAIKKIVKH